MTKQNSIRTGLIFLAVVQGLVGAVQLLAPRMFYDIPWVSLVPPYSEHLMRDVGALTLAYVLVLVVAAVTMDRLMTRTALAANLVFTVPHFFFHLTHLDGFTPFAAITQTVVLALVVLLPVALLVAAVSDARGTARLAGRSAGSAR